MGELLHTRSRSLRTVDAAHRPLQAKWHWEPKSKTAIIESARIIGLALLPPGKFHPFELDTFGLGAAIRAATEQGAKRCLIGIGGSATNDGGFGLACAMGWTFFDRDGHPIERWTELRSLAVIRAPKGRHRFGEMIAAGDVENPLLGVRGATRVYGPQKGLRRGELELAELCLRRLATVFTKTFGGNFSTATGAGAAGGLGFGLRAFLSARLESGFDVFARVAKVNQRLRSVDLAITGEGRIDASTLMGKGTGQIAQHCRKAGIPCLALAGSIEPTTGVNRTFTRVHTIMELTNLNLAKSNPAHWLERLAVHAARSADPATIEAMTWERRRLAGQSASSETPT
jgi:glycerate 2-kinase